MYQDPLSIYKQLSKYVHHVDDFVFMANIIVALRLLQNLQYLFSEITYKQIHILQLQKVIINHN